MIKNADRFPNHRKPWTTHDLNTLQFCWGMFEMSVLVRRLGRSPRSITNMAMKLGLTGSSRIERVYTMKDMMRLTGYHSVGILNVAKRLGLTICRRHVYFRKWSSSKDTARTMRWGSFRYEFSIEDVEKILEAFRHEESSHVFATKTGEWGTGGKPPACIHCGETSRPHMGRGLCRRCHAKLTKIRREIRELRSVEGATSDV